MMDYKFNDIMVACNPEREVIFNDGKRRLAVSFAEKDGRWACGYDYRYQTGGSSSAPAFNEYRESYATKQEARAAVLEVWRDKISPQNMAKTGQLDLFGGVI